jgi:hypothetical protein
MSSVRNKTLRKDAGDESHDYSTNSNLESMLENEAGNAYKKPWHRLERGLRLNRLRNFSENLATARGLKPAETVSLIQLLTKTLDNKLLNSKTSIVYDIEKEEITEIKPLVMHTNANGDCLFQIIQPRKALTFRKQRPSDGSGVKNEEL